MAKECIKEMNRKSMDGRNNNKKKERSEKTHKKSSNATFILLRYLLLCLGLICGTLDNNNSIHEDKNKMSSTNEMLKHRLQSK